MDRIRFGWIIVIGIAWTAWISGQNLISTPSQASRPLGDILNTDGTLKPNRNGSFDPRGYRLIKRSDGTPVFVKSDSIPSPEFMRRASLPGDENWDNRFQAFGTGNDVFALAVSGTDLYVSGSFIKAGGLEVNRIAKWDGTNWSALGTGANNHIRAIAINGSDVYCAGKFTLIGGIPYVRVAKWDGSVWTTLGTGVNGTINTLCFANDSLYVGGEFTTAGGSPVKNVALWNGTTWSALETGFNAQVNALCFAYGTLFAGGDFTLAGDSSTNYIAKWNGAHWTGLGSGVNAPVNALCFANDSLYVGGDFTVAGGATSANHIAQWNDTHGTWTGLGTGTDNSIATLAWIDNRLYVGGTFTTAGGLAAEKIAYWDGIAWSALSGDFDGDINAIAGYGSGLAAGGTFATIDENIFYHIAQWNGADWSRLGGIGLDGLVTTLLANGNEVYAGGYFSTSGLVYTNGMAKWNGTSWSNLGNNFFGLVSALTFHAGNLIAAGYGSPILGMAICDYIVKWDGITWTSIGGIIANPGFIPLTAVNTLASDDQYLYAGGVFNTIGSQSISYIARWDGTAWSDLGTGLNSETKALVINNGKLYAGGAFTTAGGTPANRIAQWNGTSWSALGTGMNASVNSLTCYENQLYAGGDFTQAGGTSTNYIARWDGSSWTNLSSGLNAPVTTLTFNGCQLYVGGSFTTAGGNAANRIAQFSGSGWSNLGSGLNGIPTSLCLTSDELFVGGYFSQAGDKISTFFGLYHITMAPCVTTQDADNFSTTSTMGHGTILATNGGDLITRGMIHWPYTNNDKHLGEAGVTAVNQTGSFTPESYNLAITSLAVNTHYNIRAYADNGYDTGYGERKSFWTLASIPGAPAIGDPGETSLPLTINPNGNPATVEYAIQDTATGLYVQDDATLGAVAVWKTSAAWGIPLIVRNLTPGVLYGFHIKARNGNLTETLFGPTTARKPGILTISGTIKRVETPLAGINLDLSGTRPLNTLTDESGNYRFSVYYDESFILTPSDSDYTFDPVQLQIDSIDLSIIQNFSAAYLTFPIEGIITENQIPIPGVPVKLSGDAVLTTITDVVGHYIFPALEIYRSFTVQPQHVHFDFTPIQRTISRIRSAQIADFDGKRHIWSISGQLTSQDQPIQNVIIQLRGGTEQNTITDVNGYYSFTGLLAGGHYTITPISFRYSFIPLNREYDNLGQNWETQDFSCTVQYHPISGTIHYHIDPLAGVELVLSGDSSLNVTTDEKGYYAFSGLAGGGNYTITPRKFLYVFEPESRQYTTLVGTQILQNYKAKALLPGAPQLIIPENQSQNLTLPITFCWHPVEYAASYQIHIALDSNFILYKEYTCNLTDTCFTTGDLQSYTHYYWRIQAINDISRSPWSEIRSFTTLFTCRTAQILQPTRDTTIIQGDAVYFQGSICGDTSPMIHHWDFGDGRSSTRSEPGLIRYDSTGIFTIRYWFCTPDSLHYSDTSEVRITVLPYYSCFSFITRPYSYTKGSKTWIKWTTNQAAQAELLLGSYPDQLFSRDSIKVARFRQNLVLSIPDPGKYYYRIKANRSDTLIWSAIDSFKVEALNIDITAPKILAIKTTALDTIEFIHLVLNEPAGVVCRYGLSSDNLNMTITDTLFDFEHVLKLKSLLSNTNYYYTIELTDMAGIEYWYLHNGANPSGGFNAMIPETREFITLNQSSTVRPKFLTSDVFLNHQGYLGVYWESDQYVNYRIRIYQEDRLIGQSFDSLISVTRHIWLTDHLSAGDYQVEVTLYNDLKIEKTCVLQVNLYDQIPDAPQLSKFIHQIDQDQLRIKWESNRPATSWIRWGYDQSGLDHLLVNQELVTQHDLFLNTSVINQPIYYQIKSKLAGDLNESPWSEMTAFVPDGVKEEIGQIGKPIILDIICYPNPFNSQVDIRYQLTRSIQIRYEIYDNLGRIVHSSSEQNLPAGSHHVEWDGQDRHGRMMPSGIYFLRLITPEQSLTRKLVLMR